VLENLRASLSAAQAATAAGDGKWAETLQVGDKPLQGRGALDGMRAVRAVALAGGLAALSAGALGGIAASPARASAPYAPKPPILSTPWTRSVSRRLPLTEYPRPQLERAEWLSLNGRWQYQSGGVDDQPPFGRALAQTILVPFAPESPLSGIEREDLSGWYRRLFRVPAGWRGRHVILNFGAVAWRANVYVNGRLVGSHRGDYDSFSFDITSFLRLRAPNELIVGFFDPLGRAGEPVGKQAPGTPAGFLHTAVSGIWQTVWLEPVQARHIDALELTPDLVHRRLVIRASVSNGAARIVADALAGRRTIATAAGPPGRPLVLRIPHPRPWSPWDPYLYGLRLELTEGGRVLDVVRSYFGMRSISLGRVGGAVRILLDGRFVFEAGALDQGYWPDGLYTPPTDAAIRFDILAAKRMGFDMLREHAKVQPDRWYYWADRLGILVWQDMPSISLAYPTSAGASSHAEFVRELARIVAQHRSDPAIVAWVPFNEDWGVFNPARVSAEVRRLAPGELVDTDSGSANCCNEPESGASDVRDTHLYSGPFAVAADRRASVIGEYGGVLPYPPRGHRWPGVLTSVDAPVLAWPAGPVLDLLRAQYADLRQEMRVRGLSAAVFTELSCYEEELGILTYDRRVYTIDPAAIRRLNDGLIAASRQPSDLRPQPPATPPGASGAWSFSEKHGSRAADSSGHGETLTLRGGAAWTAGPRLGGRPSGALAIAAPGESALTARRVIDTARSFTVSVWLKLARARESGTAVSEPGPDGSSFSVGVQSVPPGFPRARGGASWWTFVVPAGTRCTAAQCGVRANMRYGDGRGSPRPGRWYALTAVYDKASQTISLYVDGVSEDVEHVFGIPPADGPLTVGEGAGDYVPTDFFDGAIAALRTYARALSPAEVWQLYSAQVSGARRVSGTRSRPADERSR
jgi:hypothetical protein